jgi:serine/threonine protein kinase
VVKLAIEKASGKEWAAKIITKKDAGPKGLQMLQTEVDILSSCVHPNIVRLSEVFETDEHYYIIMELYPLLPLRPPNVFIFFKYFYLLT